MSFTELIEAMHDAGVVVDVEDGCLVLCQRHGRPLPGLVLIAASFYGRLLLWTASSRNWWRACDACGVPQIASDLHSCRMTPKCDGTLRLLPDVRARRP